MKNITINLISYFFMIITYWHIFALVFVILINAIFIADTMSSYEITEKSAMIFKYLHSHKYICYDFNDRLFVCMIIFTLAIFTFYTCLIIPFLIWIICSYIQVLNLHLQPHQIYFAIVLAWFLFVIILNALTFMYFLSYGTDIIDVNTLQLPLHLLKLIMKE